VKALSSSGSVERRWALQGLCEGWTSAPSLPEQVAGRILAGEAEREDSHAGRVYGYAIRRLVEAVPPRELVNTLSREAATSVSREGAMIALRCLGHTALEQLETALTSPSDETRWRAVTAIGGAGLIGGPQHDMADSELVALLAPLATDRSVKVRQRTLSSLGNVRSRGAACAAIPMVADALLDGSVEQTAAEALSRLIARWTELPHGERCPLPAALGPGLLGVLRDGSWYSRLLAARVIATTGHADKRVGDALLTALSLEVSRGAGAPLVGSGGHMARLDDLHRSLTRTSLVRALGKLAWNAPPGTAAVLSELAAHEQDAGTQEVLDWALSRVTLCQTVAE
jgi:hypothetical protein